MNNICLHGASCQNVTDGTLPFHCHCANKYITGLFCEIYRRCFPKARRCYVTEYKKMSIDDVTQYCKDLGQLSKPVITERAMDAALQRYMREDPINILRFGYVWLGAQADLIDFNNANWQWLDGRDTSNITLLLALFMSYFSPSLISSLLLISLRFTVLIGTFNRQCLSYFTQILPNFTPPHTISDDRGQRQTLFTCLQRNQSHSVCTRNCINRYI